MTARERRKGIAGELEVAHIYREAGLTVRGLEGSGDHLVTCGESGLLVIHSEVKRQEVARPWEWHRQAKAEAPAGTLPVVAFRRNLSPWLGLVGLERLAYLAQLAGAALDYADGRRSPSS